MFYIFLYICFFLMVFFLRITFFEKKTEKKYVYRLWFSVALIYGLYAIIASLSNEGENFLFSHSDQWKFYNLSDKLADSFSLSQIWKACFVDRVNGDNEGAYFLFGVVGYIGKHFFDGNSMMLQMICTSLFSSLIILLLYRLLLYYTNEKNAYNFALTYAILSCIFPNSAWILRDIHISLITLYILVLMHGNFSFTKLFLQVLASIVLMEFRFENGLFCLCMILMFTFVSSTSSYEKWKIILARILILCCIAISFRMLLNQVGLISQSMEDYSDYKQSTVDNSGGLIGILYRLPVGFKELAVMVYSQLQPLPCWSSFPYAETTSQYIVAFARMISPLYWTYVWYVIIRCLRTKNRPLLPFHLKILLGIFVLYLFLNTSEILVRRLMCFYPIVYATFVYYITRLSQKQHILYIWHSVVLICGLYLAYLVMYIFK